MKNKLKLFIVYFPVLLVSFQVAVNLLYFLWNSFYMSSGFYLNTFFGTNVLFAIFLVAYTFMFKFCKISRWAAIAEVLFAINFLVVKEDNMYNILFQIIVGVLAILITFSHYIKSFPLCRLSLVVGFIKSVILKGNCKKGLEQWERDVKSIILRKHHHANHGH